MRRIENKHNINNKIPGGSCNPPISASVVPMSIGLHGKACVKNFVPLSETTKSRFRMKLTYLVTYCSYSR